MKITGIVYASFIIAFIPSRNYLKVIKRNIKKQNLRSTAIVPRKLCSKYFFFTSAEREVKVSRCSGMYQSCNFLTSLGKQSL